MATYFEVSRAQTRRESLVTPLSLEMDSSWTDSVLQVQLCSNLTASVIYP